jgi:hypothetical protein
MIGYQSRYGYALTLPCIVQHVPQAKMRMPETASGGGHRDERNHWLRGPERNDYKIPAELGDARLGQGGKSRSSPLRLLHESGANSEVT